MPTKSPRVHAVLDPPLFRLVEHLARKRGRSMSQEVRDLIRDALELVEDRGLEMFAEERRRSFDRTRALTVAEVKRRLKASRARK